MSIKLGHHQAKRFALLAAILLLAAQTVAMQHVHAEPAETFCTLCASTQHDDTLLPVSQPAPAPSADNETPAVPLVSATRCAATTATHARAPPTA